MPERTLESIGEAGAAAHERFIDEMAAMDRAWANDRFDEWLEGKIADDRRNAESTD